MSIFKEMELAAFRAGITPRTKESIKWFRSKVQDLGRIERGRLMQDDALTLRNRPKTAPFGNMYMFIYNAKHKETLPYYDAFPLVIMYGLAKGGFMGLNLHYLPPPARAKALDALLGEGGISEKFIRPAIHHYLSKQVVSKFALVEKPEWEIAAFLPTADWRKASAATVYQDSKRKMAG